MSSRLCAVALDTSNARALAEFRRQLLGYNLRPKTHRPRTNLATVALTWSMLLGPRRQTNLAFLQVAMQAST